MWSEKYRPKNIVDLVGNEEARYDFVEWFTKWKKGTKPILLVGPPGIGKSSLVKEIAKEMNIPYHIIDVPLVQPIDFVAAVPNHETRTVELYPCGFIPTKGPAIVCFEDLPHAKQFQMIPVMQIIQDRRIGPVKFNDNVHFVCTGNREEDLAGTNPVISTILNRVAHFNMKADIDTWKAWAYKEGIDERIIHFITAFPDTFCAPPREGVKAWPSPRTWHKASLLIKGINDTKKIKALISSTVGAHVAELFISWFRHLRDIHPEKIIAGEKVSFADRTKTYALVLSVASYLRKNPSIVRKNEVTQNVANFAISLPTDFKIAFLKELVISQEDGKKDISILQRLLSAKGAEKLTHYVKEISQAVL
jgi:hypothetical protein